MQKDGMCAREFEIQNPDRSRCYWVQFFKVFSKFADHVATCNLAKCQARLPGMTAGPIHVNCLT